MRVALLLLLLLSRPSITGVVGSFLYSGSIIFLSFCLEKHQHIIADDDVIDPT